MCKCTETIIRRAAGLDLDGVTWQLKTANVCIESICMCTDMGWLLFALSFDLERRPKIVQFAPRRFWNISVLKYNVSRALIGDNIAGEWWGERIVVGWRPLKEGSLAQSRWKGSARFASATKLNALCRPFLHSISLFDVFSWRLKRKRNRENIAPPRSGQLAFAPPRLVAYMLIIHTSWRNSKSLRFDCDFNIASLLSILPCKMGSSRLSLLLLLATLLLFASPAAAFGAGNIGEPIDGD